MTYKNKIMNAIKVQVSFSEWEKVEDFISEMNNDDTTFVYAIDNTSMVIVTTGGCSMAYTKIQLAKWFNDPIIEIIKE
jgi:hypothetical protein